MAKGNESHKVFKILQDHEKRITTLEGKKQVKIEGKSKRWYKPGSTIEKIVLLIEEGFFNVPRAMKEIMSELKTKDYHLKASDLTLPLRKIVHKGLLKKTKRKADGSPSKVWLFVKV